MQAVPLATLNSTVMAAFKSPSLSPPSAELAQTLGKMGSSSVYEISATTSPPVTTAVDSLTDMEDKYRLGEDVLNYSSQYYSTVEDHSRASSPGGIMAASPKESGGNLTPVSVSSKDTSCSEAMSSLEDEMQGSELPPIPIDMQTRQNMCIPISSSQEQGEGTSTQIKHWTYEDQFKQLYNLSPDAERKEFLDKLFNFMQNKGTPITRVPIMAKQPLDLYKLFKLVVERGGLVEVIKKKAWRNVAKELNLPASITSAAFTMRSQYVKYLYPYECETAKLSDPQELQMAIDSNKRDRRHSENMDFMTPQLQREMDSALTPAVSTTTPQGLQLISSPTMALPHASVPQYSGGFIVAGGPGGTHVVASPQLVQMTPHGIPIVMPTPGITTPTQPQPPPLSNQSQASSEDKEDVLSHASGDSMEPPAKRPALQEPIKVSTGSNRIPYSLHQTSAGNFIMTHAGGVVSAGTTPQLIQMGTHGQLPIVVPAGSLPSVVRENPTAASSHVNGKADHLPKTETVHSVSVAAPGNVVLSQRGASVTNPHNARNLLHMAHHPNVPGLIIPQSLGVTPGVPNQPHNNGEEKRKTEAEKVTSTPNPTTLKMPFANISIQAAGGKTDSEEVNGSGSSIDASLLVTLDINNTIYQGVLFAKPQHSISSPQR